MASDDWPEWLPNGWSVQIKKIDERTVKCYLDPEGHKFYSKPQVFRHLKTINNSTASEKTHNADGSAGDIYLDPDVAHKNGVPESTPPRRSITKPTGSSSRKTKETGGCLTGDGSSSELVSYQKDGVAEWLPDGWFMEVKTRESGSRIGMRYKCYTDSVSGRKFFSKPQVLNYLANTNSSVARQRKGIRSSTKRGKPRKSVATIVKKSKAKRKKEHARVSSDHEVISRTPADGLPPGWIKEVRMRKYGSPKKDPYYLDPSSGYAFLSKLDALRYLDTGDIKKCAMKPRKRDMNEEDYHNGDNLVGGDLASQPDLSKGNETSEVVPNGCVVELKTKQSGAEYKERAGSLTGDGSSSKSRAQKDDASEWLPDGWIMEVKTRDTGSRIGMRYKCYTDPVSGRKFFSKPQVLNHLAKGNSSMTKKKQVSSTGDKSYSELDTSPNSEAVDVGLRKRSRKKKRGIRKSPCNEVVSTSPAAGLPPGWIKEIRTKKYADHERKDPYYTDPLSGYIFRSKVDALRYVETGDISTCAIKPRKRDVNGKEIPVGAVDGENSANGTPRRQLFDGKEAENSGGKQSNNVSTETLEENHTHVETSDPKTAQGTCVSTPKSCKMTRIVQNKKTKRGKSSARLPGRSSKRLKGLEPESEVQSETERNEVNGVQGKQGTREKQGRGGESQLSYEIGEGSWTDQCLDFAVKTLTGEIPVDVAPISAVPFQQESHGSEAVSERKSN